MTDIELLLNKFPEIVRKPGKNAKGEVAWTRRIVHNALLKLGLGPTDVSILTRWSVYTVKDDIRWVELSDPAQRVVREQLKWLQDEKRRLKGDEKNESDSQNCPKEGIDGN
jgi:hypothetical protein